MEDKPKKPSDNKREERRGRKPERNRYVQKESDKSLNPNPTPSEQLPNNPDNDHIKGEVRLQEQGTIASVSEQPPREQDTHREVPKQVLQQEMRLTTGKTRTKEEAATNPKEEQYVPDAEHNEAIRPAETLATPTASLRSEHDRSADNKEPVQPQLFRPAQETPESSHPKKMPRIALAQQVTKQTEKAAVEIREQIDEQPDMSPSEYAEQKTEQYTGVVVHRAESAVDRATNKLRERTVRHFREKREEQRQADRECDQADAEVQSAETDSHSEPIQEGYRYPKTEVDAVTEPEPEHLTYRERPEQMQQTKPAAKDSTAGSSNERRGGRNHAQRQAQRSDWETNASGYQSSGAAGHNATYPASEAQHSAVSPAQRLASGTEKEAHTAAQTANHGIKATQQAAKTTEQTAKTVQKTAKTTQQTAKTAQKSAQASAKAARVAKETAAKTGQALIKAGQAFGRAVEAAVKAIITAVKALIAAIAEGGWVAVIVIAVIAVIAIILGSAFGIFYSNDVSEGRPMTEAIAEINNEFVDSINAKIDRYKRRYKPDEVILVYEGDTDSQGSVMNWMDVLGVYAVGTTSDPDQPNDVLIVTPDKVELLRTYFQQMNSVSYETELETEEIPATDENGKPILVDEGEPVMETKTTLTITIRVSSMDYREAASKYRFDDSQREMLAEMMKPEYYPLYAKLTGDVIGDGGEYGFGLDINPDLPPSELGYQIVQAAKRYIGRSYASMDCSKLARTAYADVGLTSMNGLSSVRMAQKCQEMGCLFTDPSQLQAGDLIFFARFDPSRGKDYCGDVNRCGTGKCRRWLHIHHVAIYINDEYLIDSTGGDNSVQIRKHWGMNTSKWKWVCFGRPTT